MAKLLDGTRIYGSATVDTDLTVGGNIVGDGSQLTGVSKQVTGSWTLAPGANTVSFTVPGGYTYSMWVTGNIPNGICVWNATATVTNTNVPVIGSQYAWNYTGGGSPISLTSIPNQIIGTAGTISTATVANTSTNVFNFGISNTSGSNQTVYWGYTVL